MSEFILPVGLWLENQADTELEFGPEPERALPLWARQLSEAHSQGLVFVLAHATTAYAKRNLACTPITGALWPEDSTTTLIKQCLTHARATKAKKVIVILPSRSSHTMWSQWLLAELYESGAQFDELLTIMQLDRAWGDLDKGVGFERLLLSDRVLSFNGDPLVSDFVERMRALNPIALWVHNGFERKEDVADPIKAYGANAPLWLEPLKKEDLQAWGAHKVVYLSFEQPLDLDKLKHMLARWQETYGTRLMRFRAVLNLQGESLPLCVQSMQYLWSDGFADEWPEGRALLTEMWMLGQGLPWEEMEADAKNCIA